MDNSVATIQCSNLSCQASNSLTNKICHKCRTPIAKRYLLALGDWLKSLSSWGDNWRSLSFNLIQYCSRYQTQLTTPSSRRSSRCFSSLFKATSLSTSHPTNLWIFAQSRRSG
ncbi:MAG: hypothetical protein HC820_00815 [Hydrococcus sp. RM1_1_31]|nr:hypothetical protein [Hydrococcus sp. RM1_1_31]